MTHSYIGKINIQIYISKAFLVESNLLQTSTEVTENLPIYLQSNIY